MINNRRFISINAILSKVLRHPLLQDVTLESAVQYALDFIGIVGLPQNYEHKEAIVDIFDYRGILPCDLIRVVQCKDMKTQVCMRQMTGSFEINDGNHVRSLDLAFKTQGSVLYTTFKTGQVIIAYEAIATDEHGFPMIIDDPNFTTALEAYIKKEVFGVKFDLGMIRPDIYNNAEQQYAFAVARYTSKAKMPSLSEMESISRMWVQLIPRIREFGAGFETLGDSQEIKKH